MDIPIEGTGFTIHLDETQEGADKIIEISTTPRFQEMMREAQRLVALDYEFPLDWVERFMEG